MSAMPFPDGFLAAVLGQLTNGLYQTLSEAERLLCDEAAAAASNADQNRLFETVSRMRLGRLRLTDQMAQLIAMPAEAEPAFNAERAELVGMEEAVALCRRQGDGALSAVTGSLGVEPARLAACLLAWMDTAALDAHAALLVFRAFQQHVFGELPAWSQAWAEALGLAVQETPAEAAGSQPVTDEALLTLLDALQQEQAAALAGNRMMALDLPALESRIAQANVVLDKSTQETLRLVARLFDFILQASSLSAGVRQLVGFLQVPLTKVALLDEAFFDREGHSARKLLNQMSTASIGLGDATAGDPVFDAMQQAVQAVLSQFERHPAIFSDVLANLVTALERESEQAMQAEERLRSAEDLGARTESARSVVDGMLAPVLSDDGLPAVVRRFIDSLWRKVLFLAFQQEGTEGDKWAQHSKTLADLDWSVRPIATPADRQKLLKLVPQLLKDLRMGLTWAGVAQAEMDDFFKALEAIHLAHLRGKPTPGEEPAETASAAEPMADTVADDAVADTASAGTEAALEAYLRVVDGMSMGLWVEFCESEEKRFRCKLAAVIRHTGKYIFVNRSGVKVAEKTRDELARDLCEGRIEMMEDARLFDRALESVIGSARNRKA
ncbi:MAG TPA: DUF1631 family protein [Pseudomonadales bacterium]|jgi:PAS domain-containing protein